MASHAVMAFRVRPSCRQTISLLAKPFVPGQRLVIPRYNTAAAPAVRPASKAVPHTAGANGLGVHIVAPGETLIKISHIYKKSLVELAKVNKIQPHAKLNIGDKIIIPGIRTTKAQPKEATKVADAKPLGAPTPKLAAASENGTG